MPVTPDAKLDLSAASDFKASICSEGEAEVIVDLCNVTHFGALGMQVILSAGKTLKAQGRSMSIVNASDRVIDQMRVMGMTPEAIARGNT